MGLGGRAGVGGGPEAISSVGSDVDGEGASTGYGGIRSPIVRNPSPTSDPLHRPVELVLEVPYRDRLRPCAFTGIRDRT